QINLAVEETKKIFRDKINYVYDLNSVISNKVILIMLPYKELKIKAKNKVIIDLWRAIEVR
ncbi:MAG: hypothetical protein QXR88_02815, partial [Candidatus Pacearchaeota archaeon]